MICRYAVVELRRHAPKYLDQQGHIARLLLDNYGGFDVEPGPVRYEERLRTGDQAKNFNAFVSGYICAAYTMGSIDMAEFEREARVFFKLIEPVVQEGSYDRLGILFSFEVEEPDSPMRWYSEQVSSTPPDWTLTNIEARYDRARDTGGDMVLVSKWGQNLEGATPGSIRVNVDQFRADVPTREAWNFDLDLELDRARMTVEEVLHGRL